MIDQSPFERPLRGEFTYYVPLRRYIDDPQHVFEQNRGRWTQPREQQRYGFGSAPLRRGRVGKAEAQESARIDAEILAQRQRRNGSGA